MARAARSTEHTARPAMQRAPVSRAIPEHSRMRDKAFILRGRDQEVHSLHECKEKQEHENHMTHRGRGYVLHACNHLLVKRAIVHFYKIPVFMSKLSISPSYLEALSHLRAKLSRELGTDL
jgi:hypothetical protein